jgi:hypothetical protein
MIHHVYLPVTDWSRSLRLYRPLLPTIGIEEGRRLGDSVGFGLGAPGAQSPTMTVAGWPRMAPASSLASMSPSGRGRGPRLPPSPVRRPKACAAPAAAAYRDRRPGLGAGTRVTWSRPRDRSRGRRRGLHRSLREQQGRRRFDPISRGRQHQWRGRRTCVHLDRRRGQPVLGRHAVQARGGTGCG